MDKPQNENDLETNRQDEGKPQTKRRLLKTIGFVIILGFLINTVIVFLSGSVETLQTLAQMNTWTLLLPFGFYFVNYLIDSLRYKLCLSQFGYKLSFGAAMYNNIIGVFFSNLTPMSAGGQPFQIIHFQSIGIDTKSATNVIMSRYIEYMVTILLIIALAFPKALALMGQLKAGAVVLSVGIAVTLLMTLLVLFFYVFPDKFGAFSLNLARKGFGRWIAKISKKPDWAESLFKWSEELKANINFLWKEKLHIMIFDFVLGFVALCLQALSLYFVFKLMVPDMPVLPTDFGLAYVLINLVAYYVPTPGATGGIEAFYTVIFGELIHNPAMAAGAIFTWRISSYYLHLFFGAFVFFLANPGSKVKGSRLWANRFDTLINQRADSSRGNKNA